MKKSNQPSVKVIPVTHAPVLKGKVLIQRGIRTMESAEAWGRKQGMTSVYWIRSQEKVYGCIADTINSQAQVIEQKSRTLLTLSENGRVRDELAVIFGLAAVMVIFACIVWIAVPK